jgi:hypothetical protein
MYLPTSFLLMLYRRGHVCQQKFVFSYVNIVNNQICQVRENGALLQMQI